MDFRQLEYVLTVARERTLLAAAEKLYLSPSALSQHISRLEEELHTPLFKRTKDGWLPTHAGRIYLDMAEQVLNCQKKAYLQISDIADTRVGHFTVGVTSGRGTMMFSSIFPRFQQEYANIKVGLVEGTVLEISEQIAVGKVDLGFLTNVLAYPRVVTRTQVQEEILLALPRSHPLAHLAQPQRGGPFAQVDLRLFAQDEFLLAGKGTTLRTLEDRMFDQAGFVPRVAFETDSLTTLNMLAKGGYGPAFIPRFYVDETREVVYLRTNPSASWELVAAYHQDHYVTKAEEHMISLATDYYLGK